MGSDRPRDFVVVPEGLEADAGGAGTAAPSGPFGLVLDRVASIARANDQIFIAPANDFGGPLSEQEAAFLYLRSRTTTKIIRFAAASEDYIDTRGNAALLRRFLEAAGLWPLPNPTLVAYRIHMRRAALIFRQEGFEFKSLLPVDGAFDQGKVPVARLWYIRYPRVHKLYEMLATPAFFLRIR